MHSDFKPMSISVPTHINKAHNWVARHPSEIVKARMEFTHLSYFLIHLVVAPAKIFINNLTPLLCKRLILVVGGVDPIGSFLCPHASVIGPACLLNIEAWASTNLCRFWSITSSSSPRTWGLRSTRERTPVSSFNVPPSCWPPLLFLSFSLLSASSVLFPLPLLCNLSKLVTSNTMRPSPSLLNIPKLEPCWSMAMGLSGIQTTSSF